MSIPRRAAASLRVNYFLTADFAAGGKAVRVETEARNKTTFHLLLAPLSPEADAAPVRLRPELQALVGGP